MSNAQHTPGAWSFWFRPDLPHGDTFYLLRGPEGDDGGSILEGSLVLGDDAENLANAHLIAAAPDLLSEARRDLEFAKSVVFFLKATGNKSDVLFASAEMRVAMLSAVIAKAKVRL